MVANAIEAMALLHATTTTWVDRNGIHRVARPESLRPRHPLL